MSSQPLKSISGAKVERNISVLRLHGTVNIPSLGGALSKVENVSDGRRLFHYMREVSNGVEFSYTNGGKTFTYLIPWPTIMLVEYE